MLMSLQALLHPFRPLSSSFPPGELPPPSVLDELTHQIVKYAYRPSPVKRGRSKQPPKPRPHEDGWSHTWDATRRKLFRVALAESQSAHGMDAEDKKLPRVERVQRPGLKRMDSMDFLDQEQEEEVADRGVGSSGLAAQLSTSLQNTARSNPLGFLSRTQSDDVTTTTSSISASTSTPTALETPAIPAAITITPASPVAAPPLRRRGSSRVSQPRSSRPSLLQRGRSFTASDLEADPSIPDSPIAPAKTARGDAVTIPPTAAAAMASLQAGPTLLDAPSSSRLTRSRSGLTLNPHPCRTAFLADRKPTTTEKCALALPFDAGPIRGPARTQPVNGGWSDSDDEQSSKVRHVKKVKPARNSRPLMMMTPALQPALQAEMLGGPDLRSPFEEKSGMTC